MTARALCAPTTRSVHVARVNLEKYELEQNLSGRQTHLSAITRSSAVATDTADVNPHTTQQGDQLKHEIQCLQDELHAMCITIEQEKFRQINAISAFKEADSIEEGPMTKPASRNSRI